MKKFFKELKKDSVLLWSFWIGTASCIIAVIAIAVSYNSLPPVIPIYNHMPWGYARLGNKYELFLLPIFTFGLILLNSIVGIKLLLKIPLLTRFLFLTMVTLSFFMLVFVARLIFIAL